jgi:Ca-activated chloride channel family protein
MKKVAVFLLVLLTWNSVSLSNSSENDDRTLSPYFWVKGGDSTVESLPLLKTSGKVQIDGVIADITITQVYKNSGKKPIEAVYVFPASTRAAVYGMKMIIQDRILVAEIQKKEEARATYEKAKAEGKSTSLLEQDRPNVFTMNVANILPGDTITVELKYTELLEPKEGIYEFVYPTVVGPRYSEKTMANATNDDKFVNSPYQKEGEMPLYEFNLEAEIISGIPINEVICSSHKIKINKKNEMCTIINLDESEKNGGNRDFILQYRLRGENIQTGLMMTENGDENFFLLMVQPPKRVENKQIVPKQYIFVVDESGSQEGYPLKISKKLINDLLDKLNKTDRFNIIIFSDAYKEAFDETVEATYDNIEKAKEFMEKPFEHSGTRILSAIKQAMSYKRIEGYSKIIAVLTDGFVENETATFDYITENLNDANIFAFGIGKSVNRYYIEGIARLGMGEVFVATKPDSAESLAKKFIEYTQSPVLTNIKIDFGDFWTDDVFPTSAPDLFADRPLIIYGKWKKPMAGTISIKGKTNEQELSVQIPILKFGELYEGNALKYLWARNKIAILSDYATFGNEKKYEPDVTALGLQYQLLTKYTSFVAVDYLVRNTDSGLVKVKQVIPLPEGVSNSAIGSGNLTGFYPNGSNSIMSKASSSGFFGSSGGSGGKQNPINPVYERAPIYLGPIFGYSRNFLTNNIQPTYAFSAPVTGVKPVGNGYNIGLSYEEMLGDIENSISSLIFNLNYKGMNFSSEKSFINTGYNNLMLDLTGRESDSLNTSINYKNELSLSSLNFEVLYKLNFIPEIPLGIIIGPSFDFSMKHDLKESLTLDNADQTLKFKNQTGIILNETGRNGTLFNDKIPDNNSFQLIIKVGIQYEILLSNRMYMSPYFIYGHNITNLIKDTGIKLSNLNFGFAIHFLI